MKAHVYIFNYLKLYCNRWFTVINCSYYFSYRNHIIIIYRKLAEPLYTTKMKKLILFILCLLCVNFKTTAQGLQTFHDFTAETILGDTISLSSFAGKKVLVVNTASFCSYTPQFAELQALDSTYSSYNFEVIGFPCNDFGGQDPHNDSTINGYCTGTYGVTFQMMSKIFIIEPDTAPVYKWLQTGALNGVMDAPVTWNFNKFCIDESGHWIRHFPSQTLPFDTAITNWITGTPTSLASLTNEPRIEISNNPVYDNFTLYLKDIKNKTSVNVYMYSEEGRLIENIFDDEINTEQEIVCDTKKLETGIYLLKVVANDAVKSIKISVIH